MTKSPPHKDDESWLPEIQELQRRKLLAQKMGGPEKVARQKANNRLNVRQRILALLDKDSFREIGAIAGKASYKPDQVTIDSFTPANFVTGTGTLNQRPVIVGGDDFTVRGGAADAAIREKMVLSEHAANQWRIPLVRLIDGTGGGGSVKSLEVDGRTYVPANPAWNFVVDNLSVVPVVSLGLGPVAGLGAARLASSHLAVMVKDISQMFVAGPPVVRRLGEDVDKESLGGALVHAKNGAVDFIADSEQHAFQIARQFLSYLPDSVFELPPRSTPTDNPTRREERLIRAVPKDRRKPYNVRNIIHDVVDLNSFLEIGSMWGRSIVTGLARLDGWPVAVMAGNPLSYGGGWSVETSFKATRFVDLAQTFHIPVVHLVDNPGFVIGVEAEKAATIRHGVRAAAAIYQATVPWCSIIMRKVFGVAGAAHVDHTQAKFRYAWPSADWGSLPVEGGVEAAYRSELEASDNPEQLLKDVTARLNKVRSPFRTAEAFTIENIIDPRDTRTVLCEFANLTAKLRTTGRPSFGTRP